MTLDVVLPSDSSFSIFTGLVSESQFQFKIMHSFLGASVENFKINFDLVNGQKLVTTLNWRKEMVKDVQYFVRWVANKIDSQTFISDIDMGQLLESLEAFSINVADDLVLNNAEIDYEAIRSDLHNGVEVIELNLVGRPNVNENLLNYILSSTNEWIDSR